MKKKKIFALMAAALSLTACSTNDVADITHDDADNVVNVASVTRSGEGASTTSPMTAPFHLINITQATKRNVNFEADFTYDNNTNQYAQTGDSKVVWYNVKDADGNEIPNEFKAFSPIKTDKNNASLETFNLPTDQSSATLLQSADWMTGKPDPNPIKKSAAPSGLALKFSHNYAKLCFAIDPQDDITESDLSGADIKVLGSIKPYYNSTFKTIEAIVEPKAYTQNDKIIQISLSNGGESYALNFLQPITFEAGKQYNYSLKLGHNAITISSVSVSDWEDESVSSDEDEAWIRFDDSSVEYITFTAASDQGFMFFQPPSGNGGDGGDGDEEGDYQLAHIRMSQYITRAEDTSTSGFEYSVDNGEWIAIPAAGITEAIPFGGEKGTLRLRGKNLNGTATGYYGMTAKIISFTNNVPVSCTGDIRTLLDYENYTTVSTADACFSKLFQNCSQLTSAPKLPATDLNGACYLSMFKGCTSLTTAPELPATILSSNCYQSMFEGCTSLTTAPELKAMTLVQQCYDGMFDGCTNLSSVTMLATKIRDYNCLMKWLNNAGTLAQSRTLKLKNVDVYNTIKDKIDDFYDAPILPDLWKSGTNGATVIYEDNNP